MPRWIKQKLKDSSLQKIFKTAKSLGQETLLFKKLSHRTMLTTRLAVLDRELDLLFQQMGIPNPFMEEEDVRTADEDPGSSH